MKTKDKKSDINKLSDDDKKKILEKYIKGLMKEKSENNNRTSIFYYSAGGDNVNDTECMTYCIEYKDEKLNVYISDDIIGSKLFEVYEVSCDDYIGEDVDIMVEYNRKDNTYNIYKEYVMNTNCTDTIEEELELDDEPYKMMCNILQNPSDSIDIDAYHFMVDDSKIETNDDVKDLLEDNTVLVPSNSIIYLPSLVKLLNIIRDSVDDIIYSGVYTGDSGYEIDISDLNDISVYYLKNDNKDTSRDKKFMVEVSYSYPEGSSTSDTIAEDITLDELYDKLKDYLVVEKAKEK